MRLTRRDFLRASSALSAAFGLGVLADESDAEAAAAPTTPPVVWLQAQSCSGCSVSLLNSMYYMDAASLLTKTVSMRYHSTLMAAAGANAVASAQAAWNQRGYILVVEGSIPTGNLVNYCFLWPGLAAMKGVQDYARNAAFVIAAGSCSAFGGIPAARPNPTSVRALSAVVGVSKVINIPGCPIHPDWLIGTVAYLLANKKAPPLDSLRRPKAFYPEIIHESCPYHDDDEDEREQGAGTDSSGVGVGHCLKSIGCKGPKSVCDCHRRRWNTAAANTPGTNFCMSGGGPCIGCTEPGFPDGMSPFYKGSGGEDEEDEEDEEEGRRTRTESASDSTATPTTQTPTEQTPTSTPTKDNLTPYQKRQAEKRAEYQKRKERLQKEYQRSKLKD